MNIQKYGLSPSILPENHAGIPARITAVHRELFEFACSNGTGIARLKASAYHTGGQIFPTTGDFVLLDWHADGESRIVQTLPRKSYFSRVDPSSSGHAEQIVAANFDYVFILQSLDCKINLHRLERYLTLAWQTGAVPAVLLTKADCVADYTQQQRLVEQLAIGVGVFAISAKNGSGLSHLSSYLQPGKTIVFLGSSGVGKSTLVNALAQKTVMATGAIRQKDGRGRHTTSHRQLVLLESGVLIIDTPGMREIGMWDVSEGLGKSFAHVEKYFGQCKFRDCRHQDEPDCAVKAAIQRGDLLLEHWESYLRLNAEAHFASDKAAYLRKKDQWGKDIAKKLRQRQKQSYQHTPCTESFICKACGISVSPENAGTSHRNHCPHCLSSVHVDSKSGDRASVCRGIMEPIGVWVKKNGEWALIHRCQSCGTLRSNRVAADDNAALLHTLAMQPMESPAFPAAADNVAPTAE